MFSAYDLKKIIPRAIFALVAVNLSWGLMEIFIKGVEAIGNGAQELVMAPFGSNVGVQLGGTSNLAFSTIIAAAAGAALIGIIPVLGVAVSGLFGLLFAFGIIMLRKIMLIGLIIVAPVAIALSVFPQTESWAKKWWDWFSKLMLMYPFLMAMFGISEVAAGIISRTEGNEFEQLIYKLGAVIILIIPYFLVGKALTLAGGAIGKVAGMVNNKDRGIIDKTKKWEQGKVAERRYDAARGQRYGGRNFVTRGINRSLRAGAHPGTVIGRQSNRDAGVLALVQQNADTMESRHEGAKTMSKDERAIHALVSNESEASDQIESLALRRAEEAGRAGDTVFIDQEKAKLKLAYESGKKKMGGSVDTGSQLYSLQKAVAEGAISPEQAEQAATRLAGKLATGGAQQERMAEILHTQLDSAASAAGHVPGVVTAARVANRTTGPSTAAPPTVNHDAVNRMFNGPSSLSHEQLANLQPEAVETVTSSKTQQANSSLSVVSSTSSSVDDVVAATNNLVRHRSDLLVANAAAAKAGKQQVVEQTRSAIEQIDLDIQDAEAAAGGRLSGLHAHVQGESDQQATQRFKPI